MYIVMIEAYLELLRFLVLRIGKKTNFEENGFKILCVHMFPLWFIEGGLLR